MNARGWILVPVLASLIAACGGSASPSAPASSTTASGSSTQRGATGPATSTQLQAAAAKVYPPCLASTCSARGATFTTCDSGGLSGSVGAMGDTLAPCPLTDRMRQQLQADTDGVTSAPDPLGGGQEELFTSESFTEEPSGTGGVVHASLVAVGGGTAKTDLVFANNGSGLQLDDVYCTGHDRATTDAYAAGWLTRATCSA